MGTIIENRNVTSLHRLNGGIGHLLQVLCRTQSKRLLVLLTRALEQIMVSGNRAYISGHTLFQKIVATVSRQDVPDLIQYGIGVLENLFKESAGTCHCLIRDGGLNGVIQGCRSTNPVILQHCAAALTNCAMYGSPDCHELMIHCKVEHWLFPLAFSEDNVVKYYALLGVSYLAANERIVDRVMESGTLDLVLLFLHSHDPDKFAASCPSHSHGRSAGWLTRLKPLLVSDCEEARSIAAFHFAMESTIKKKQNKINVCTYMGENPYTQLLLIRTLQWNPNSYTNGADLISEVSSHARTVMKVSLILGRRPHFRGREGLPIYKFFTHCRYISVKIAILCVSLGWCAGIQ